jgi:hypothetical protein
VLSVYERSRQVLGWDGAVPDELDVTATRMAVVFMASRGTGPGRTLTFDLALTNGSTLKDHTRRERLIDEKYLERWGLVAVVKRAAATPAAELVR